MYPTCPECKNTITGLGDRYDGTVQCGKCAKVLHVVVKDGTVVHASMRSIFLEVPGGLPEDLRTILDQAAACYEVGSNAAAVVLAGLFVEGLLKAIGLSGDRFVEMIDQAHKEKVVSTLGYHVATASRLMRNMGAHYSPELASLSRSDARLVLEMARKLAADVAASGRLSKE